MTLSLCGSWEHDGPCRWPHHTSIDTSVFPARIRTVFVADEASEGPVRKLISDALEAGQGWDLVSSKAADLDHEELPLADNLRSGPAAASSETTDPPGNKEASNQAE